MADDDDVVDPLEWEEEQLKKLASVADKCGWKPTHHQYRARMKLIQQKTLQLMQRAVGADAAPAAVGRAHSLTNNSLVQDAIIKRPAVGKWYSNPQQKWARFKSFKSAKALLGVPPHGPWMTDRDAPGSTNWRRYISIDKKTQKFQRKRIIQGQGEL